MRSETGDGAAAFEELSSRVRAGVDARLASLLEARAAESRRMKTGTANAAPWGADLAAVFDAVRDLAMRGGKRVRAVLCAAAYEGCGGEGGADAVVMAGVALELLQTYLLIHDDWMDDDDVRRGGPSVHVMLRERFTSRHDGDAGAVLAGDLAVAFAQQALLETPVPAERLAQAARAFARMQADVVRGQVIDLRASAPDAAGVEAMHDLKTGSYTVRGPVTLGALLAGASSDRGEALARFASPLGVAFQLRDDVLGTFGDPRATGKPSGSDLRQGKRTSLVVEAERDAEARRLLPRVLGVADASEDEVDAVVRRIEASGARARIEARIDALMAQARAALDRVDLEPRARAVLAHAVTALGTRER
jgi:geranylgeranyl diphosphate synthase type I